MPHDDTVKAEKEKHRVSVFGDGGGSLGGTTEARVFATFMNPVRRVRTHRVIIAVDLDCFYAQVELLSRPELRDKPVAVTQQHIVVTSNYVARGKGVGKLVNIVEAQKLCPDLVLINGEDLTGYRVANEKVYHAIRSMCGARTNIEKLGLDEFFVDVTEIVRQRIQERAYQYCFDGYVYPEAHSLNVSSIEGEDIEVERKLMVGSQLAKELRRKIKEESGLTCCAGVSTNKMLAKFAANMHKPNQQTSLLPSGAADYVADLPLRKFPGVGWKAHYDLKFKLPDDIRTAGDLRRAFNFPQLEHLLGTKQATFLWTLVSGEDSSEVKNSEASKIVSVEDSFKSAKTWDEVREIIRKLCAELQTRLRVDADLHGGRRPNTLRVVHRRARKNRESQSAAFPNAIGDEPQALYKSTMQLLQKATLQEPFHLTLLGIGACNFTSATPTTRKTLKDFFKSEKNTGVKCPLCQCNLSGKGNEDLNRHIDNCLQGNSSHVG